MDIMGERSPASEQADRKIDQIKTENARMRAALEVLAESTEAAQWVRALAITALDGKIPLSA